MIQIYIQNKNRLRDIKNWLMATKGEVWDKHVYTTIYKADNQQGPAVYHREITHYFTTSYKGKEY